ncbi:FkbM family methyltransferase [Candidatus Actinomarina]|nr:FkbM family methyltransferase [Candidatus Actinomarina sp.]|tara:strand:- start:17197 stop:18021 length:825 start_codon:yes stop_codon:yes gene_type:complete
MKKLIIKFIPASIKPKIKVLIRKFKTSNINQKIIEHMEIDFILSRLHSQKKIKILEIGSHKGELFNIISPNNFSQNFYITFIEPNPKSYQILKKEYRFKLRRFIKATFYNFGIGNKDGISTFYSPSVSSALFTLKKENLDKFNLQNENVNELEIKTYTIETLLKKKNFISNYFDIIKVDAEGYDYDITLQLIDNEIIFNSLMIELDSTNLELLFKIIEKLKNYTPFIFLRDGIKTLTIEKINNKNDFQELINFYQKSMFNDIAGNIVFVSNNEK